MFNALKRKLATPVPLVDPHTLPEIPAGWDPSSVSMAEKRYDVIEKAKKTAGFPTTDEAYYLPAAVAQMSNIEPETTLSGRDEGLL